MDKPWKVIFAFVGIFVAGAVAGGFFGHRRAVKQLFANMPAPVVIAPTPMPVSMTNAPKATTPAPRPLPPTQIQPAVMRQLTQRLNLTNDQKKKVAPVVARANEDLQRLRRENLQDTTRVVDQMYTDVMAVLTPEQREQLEDMKRKMQERVAEEKRRREAEARAARGNASQ